MNEIKDPSIEGINGLKGLKGLNTNQLSISPLEYLLMSNYAIKRPTEQFTGFVGLNDSSYDKNITTRDLLEDLNQHRALSQSAGAKLFNALSKGAVLAGTTFLDGTAGLIFGIGQGIYNTLDKDNQGNNFYSGLWNNDFSLAMNNLTSNMEQLLPNYYTEDEMNNPLSLDNTVFSSNFWGDKVLKNMGFMVGAAYSGNAFNSALKVSKIPLLIGQLSNKVKAIKAVNMVVGSTVAALNEARIEGLGSALEFHDSEHLKYDKIFEERLSSIELYKDTKMYDLLKSNILKEKDLIDKKIEDGMIEVGNTTMGINTAILSLSNMFVLGKMFANGFETLRLVGNVTKRLGLYQSNASVAKGLFKGILDAGSEGVEEFSQSVTSNYAKYHENQKLNSFYEAMINPNSEKLTVNWINSFVTTLGESLRDSSSQEEALVGALSGALGLPSIRRGASGKRHLTFESGIIGDVISSIDEKRESSELANKMNQRVKSPEFLALYQGAIRHNKYLVDIEEALEKNDIFSFKNAEYSQVLSDIAMFRKAGRLNDFKTMVSELGDTSKDNLESIIVNSSTIVKPEGGTPTINGPFAKYAIIEDNLIKPNINSKVEYDELALVITKNKESITNTIDIFNKTIEDIDLNIGDRIDDEQLENIALYKLMADHLNERRNKIIELVSPVINDLSKVLQVEEEIDNAVLKNGNNLFNKFISANNIIKSKILSNSRYNDMMLYYLIDNGIRDKNILQLIYDIRLINEAYDNYMDKYNTYMKEPENYHKDIELIRENVSVAKVIADKNIIELKLSRATNLEEFRLAVDDLGIKNLNSLAIGNSLSDLYVLIESRKKLIENEINNIDLDNNLKQDINILLQALYKNSNNIEEFKDNTSDILSNDSILDSKYLYRELSKSQYLIAKYYLDDIMNNIEKDALSKKNTYDIIGELLDINKYDVKTVEEKKKDKEKLEKEELYKNKKSKEVFKEEAEELSKEEKERKEKISSMFALAISFNEDPTLLETNEGKEEKKEGIITPIGNDNIKDVGNDNTAPSITLKEIIEATEDIGEVGVIPKGVEVEVINNEDTHSVNDNISILDSPPLGNFNNDTYAYYRPAISLVVINAERTYDYRPLYQVIGDNYKAIYDYLESNGAFDYLNNGNLLAGDTLSFVIDPFYSDDLIFFSHNNNVIGALTNNPEQQVKYRNLSEVYEFIMKEYEYYKKELEDKKLPNDKIFQASLSVPVSKIMHGKILKTLKEDFRTLNTIEGVNKDSKFGIIRNGSIETNGSLKASEIITLKDIGIEKEGRIYLMLKTLKGYLPYMVNSSTMREALNKGLFLNSELYKKIVSIVDELSKIHDETSLFEIKEKLDDYVYLKNHKIFLDEVRDSTFLAIKERDSEGKLHTIKAFDISLPDLKELLLNYIIDNYNISVDINKINNPVYNEMLIQSGLLLTNLSSVKIVDTWFITDYIDLKKGILKADFKKNESYKSKETTINHPTIDKGDIEDEDRPYDYKVSINGKDYFVLKEGTITDENGRNALKHIIEKVLIAIELNNKYGNTLTSNDGKLIDSIYSLDDGRLFNRNSNTFLTNKEKEVLKKKEKSLPKVEIDETKSSEILNTTLAKLELDLKRVIKDKTDSEFYYILNEDGTEEKYNRVHSVIGSNWKTKFEGTNNNPLIAGSTIDNIVRDFFNGNEVLKPEGIEEKPFNDLMVTLQDIKKQLDKKGLRFITNNIVLFGEYNGVKLAGEIDILTIDKEGRFSIIDLKTSKGSFVYRNINGKLIRYYDTLNPNYQYRTDKELHTLLLSAYQYMFESNYGSPIINLGILPYTISYNNDAIITSIKRHNYIPLTYNSDIETIIGNYGKAEEESSHNFFESKVVINDSLTLTKQIREAKILSLGNILGINSYIAIVPFKLGEATLGNSIYLTFDNGLTYNIGYYNGLLDEVMISDYRNKAVIAINNNLNDFKLLSKSNSPINNIRNNQGSPLEKIIGEGKSEELIEKLKEEDKAQLSKDDTAKLFDRTSSTKDSRRSRGPKFRITEDSYTKTSIEKELEWLDKVLPQLDKTGRVKLVKGLINVANKGTTAWGLYDRGIITLSDMASLGTVYHEAFHLVFDLYLNEKELETILKEAQDKWGNKSKLELEELIAEEFRNYTIIKETSLSGKILDFFKNLLYKIINWKYLRPNLNTYYKMINNGYYALDRYRDITYKISYDRLKEDTKSKLEESGINELIFNSLPKAIQDNITYCI